MNASQPAGPRKGNSAKTIFVVDDEPMLLELATIVLSPLGHEVTTFRDPDSALQAFVRANPRPALIITDYAMHNMSGMDLIAECKRLQPGQKIILVSGTVGQEVFNNSAFKPDRFLAKPYEVRQLTEIVNALLKE
jgi:DNA-binding NtrC family response regulator